LPVVVAAAAALLAATVGVVAGAGAAPSRPAGGTLAVGNGEYVFTVRSDGSGGHAIGAGDYPAYSHDGRIAFTLNGVWTANAGGSARRHIVPRFADYLTYASPTWSPDDDHIAYIRIDNGHETSELWVVRADGADLHGLSIVHFADMPAWSPDGKWIAYVGDGGLSEVLSDGSGKRLLLRRAVVSPAWSPDGARIAFEEQSGPETSIAVLDIGSGKVRLVERHRGSAGPLAWSPDGRRIAFTVQRSNARGSYFDLRTTAVGNGKEHVVTRLFVQRVDGLAWRR
jgi:dipeptidyl aminopeptidase/acylaminoacyl peptidase